MYVYPTRGALKQGAENRDWVSSKGRDVPPKQQEDLDPIQSVKWRYYN